MIIVIKKKLMLSHSYKFRGRENKKMPAAGVFIRQRQKTVMTPICAANKEKTKLL
jgi:hypothetical protein